MNAIIDPRAVMAAENNADWYGMMGDLCGRRYDRQPQAFFMPDPPPYHSHMTTLDPGATGAQLDLVAKHQGLSGFGIKDGFAQLDLTGFGLEIGFTAHWIWADAPAPADTTDWHQVTTPQALAAWTAGWGETSPGSPQHFPDAILDRQDVAIWGRVTGGDYVAGGIANLSPDCTGISNFFGTAAIPPLAQLAHGFGGHRPCVGYARGDLLSGAQACGFVTTGPLNVWFSPKP